MLIPAINLVSVLPVINGIIGICRIMAPGTDIDVIELEMQKTLAVRAAHRLKHPDSRKYYQGSGDNEEENVKQGHGTVLSRMHRSESQYGKTAEHNPITGQPVKSGISELLHNLSLLIPEISPGSPGGC